MLQCVVQLAKTAFQVREKRFKAGPWWWRFQLAGNHQLFVIAELRVAFVAEHAPCGRLQRDQVLIIGRADAQRLAQRQRASGIAHPQHRCCCERTCRRIGRYRSQCAIRQVQCGVRIEFQCREAGAHQQGRWRLRAADPRGEARPGVTRVTCTLQYRGLGGPQRIVVGERPQRAIELRRRRRDIAGTHPYQPSEISLRIHMLRFQPQAIAQRRFRAIELAQGRQATRLRVTQGRRARTLIQGTPSDGFSFFVVVCRLQCDGECLGSCGIFRRPRDERPVVSDRILAPAQRNQRRHVLDGQFRRHVGFVAKRREDRQRTRRLPAIVVKAREYRCRTRIRRLSGGGLLQVRLRLGMSAAAEQQFSQRGQGRGPVRVALQGAPQDPFRATRIAQRQLGAAEQPLRLGVIGMFIGDRHQAIVCRAEFARLQQLIDPLHRFEKRRRRHLHGIIAMWIAIVACLRRPDRW